MYDTKFAVYERIPVEYSQLVIMLTMLLPGTNVVYYGNEIGLDSVNIRCRDSRDPYALAECEDLEGEDYPKVSRDPGRTPMQVLARVLRWCRPYRLQ